MTTSSSNAVGEKLSSIAILCYADRSAPELWELRMVIHCGANEQRD